MSSISERSASEMIGIMTAAASNPRKITVAVDFDGTYTLSPPVVEAMINAALRWGNTVIVITNRGDHRSPTAESVIAESFGERVAVIRAYGEPKERAALAAGYKVDIWIDDEPWKIRRGP